MSEVSDIVRAYYAAYQAKDRSAIEALVGDDFSFSSPYDDHIDRTLYFQKCWPNSEHHDRFRIEKLFVRGNEAFVRYELRLNSGVTFRNTEFLRLEAGKIKEVEVYFGNQQGSVQKPE